MFYRLIGYLPFSLIYPLARCAGALLHHVIRYRRAVVADNLAHAFPELTAAERQRIARQFYRRLCEVALEILRARRMTRDDFRRRVQVLNPELVERYAEGFSRSVIVMTIHQGNWEWMLHGATTALGIPIDPVYKPLHNATVDRLVREIRGQFGSRPLAAADAPRDILRRRREFRLFVMVADQSPTRQERGYWTQFLHRDACFYLGAESIARATGFPVLFARCHRRGRGYYAVEFQELACPPWPEPDHAITERYVALAQAAIRDDPASWLWSNRRWKRQRPAEEPAPAPAR